MPAKPQFTSGDLAEARRLNARLDKLPRFRMKTTLGRAAWNLWLRAAELFHGNGPAGDEVRLEKRAIESHGRKVALRIFHPRRAALATVLHIHGGGWTVGNARMNDRANAELALCGYTVISVDYRLAIAGPITESIADCEAAALWLMDEAGGEHEGRPILIVGESAGAHLGAATLIRLRDLGRVQAISGAVFFFGLYDFSGTPMIRNAGADTLILHGPTIRAVLEKLSPDMTSAERAASELSPVNRELHDLPPALFIVGTRDVLEEDSRRMHARWDAASGNAALLIAPESPHAFNRFRTAIRRKVDDYVRAWLAEKVA